MQTSKVWDKSLCFWKNDLFVCLNMKLILLKSLYKFVIGVRWIYNWVVVDVNKKIKSIYPKKKI